MLSTHIRDIHSAYIDTSIEWNKVKVACVICAYECMCVCISLCVSQYIFAVQRMRPVRKFFFFFVFINHPSISFVFAFFLIIRRSSAHTHTTYNLTHLNRDLAEPFIVVRQWRASLIDWNDQEAVTTRDDFIAIRIRIRIYRHFNYLVFFLNLLFRCLWSIVDHFLRFFGNHRGTCEFSLML